MSVHDALVAPVWLAVNLLVAMAMWQAAGGMLPGDVFFERLRHTIVLCWATVVLVGIILGASGVLSAAGLLAGVTAVAGVVWWCRRRWGNKGEELSTLAAAEPPACAASLEGYPAAERWCWACWGFWAAWCVGHVVVSGLLEYPSDWDTLTYHLPFVDRWLQAGSLYVPGAAKWFFPANNELVALWMVAPFSGDFLAPLNNLPATMLLVLSALELARLLGVGTLLRHAGVLALISTYVVSHQLLDNKNDVAAAALLFSFLAYAFRYAGAFRKGDLLLAAVSLGLLSGVKYYALFYAAAGLVMIVALAASCRGRRAGLGAALLCLLALVVWGGYWYGRNLVATGMPLYPRGITPEQSANSGLNPDLGRTSLLGNPSPERWPRWLEALWRIAGPCHVAALVLLPAGLLWLGLSGPLLARRQKGTIDMNLRWTLAGVTVAAAVLYGVTPFTIEIHPGTLDMLRTGYVTIRMGLCFLSLTILCGLVVVNDTIPFPGWWQGLSGSDKSEGTLSLTAAAPRTVLGRVLAPAFLLAGAAAVLYHLAVPRRLEGASFAIDRRLSQQLVPSFLVAADLVALAVILWRLRSHFDRHPRLAKAGGLMALFATVALACGMLGARWHRGFAAHYDGFFRTGVFSFLEGSVGGGERICVFAHRSYPFAGSRRQFLVVAAHPTAAQPERFRSTETVLRFLHRQRATMVAIRGRSEYWYVPGVDKWGDEHPAVFETLLSSGSFVLKRVNRQLLERQLHFEQSTVKGEGSIVKRGEHER